MSFRLPQTLSNPDDTASGASLLESEILAEKASALGRAGQDVAAALRALAQFDETGGGAIPRTALLRAAADAVWGFLVQRELCGLRDREQVIRDYRIPAEVLRRLGAR